MKLSIDLNTGNEPDIIIFYCTSPDAYASKGYLVDLYTLMENDDQLSPNDILVREALEQNGSLYAIPPTFTIGTLCGKTEDVEQFKGWTFDDYFSFDSENVPFKLSLFDSLPFYVQSALDWDKGEANFDTELFVNILKAGKEAEESPVDGNEEQIFQYISLKSPLDINSEEAELGEDISLVGYPCFDGMYGGTIEFGQRLGIVSTSENIDGAWELIKTIMYYDRITNGTRSILKPVKEALISELLDPHDETGKPIDPMITQSNIDKYYEVLESCTVSQVCDYNIQIIIYDEFARYCAGQIEAEECAEAIQSRVSIYMSEQN
jgi:ABC-type glycerol-3-phosphate transport system substrate-binding protein